jgi:HSP20 family molecular chaperone IbpA
MFYNNDWLNDNLISTTAIDLVEDEFKKIFGECKRDNCKCKKPSCEVNTNSKEMVINKTYYDWEEFDGKYTKSIVLPCSKQNISLHILDGEKVTIDYEETNVKESPNSYETHTFSGSISFLLPPDANEATLSAKYEDNFLHLYVEKRTLEHITSREICVE